MKLVLFDLDGTLTESHPGIINSVQYALAKLGIEEKEPERLVAFVGPPLRQSFQKFYGLSEAEADQAVTFYREYFRERGMYENRVYAGVPELLAGLTRSGRRLAVATSKPTLFAEKILAHFQLDQYFAAIVGSHLDGSRVNKGEVIRDALGLFAVERDQVLMVGDREHDVIGARENGIKVIAVTYGYGSVAELTAARPDFLAASVTELRQLLL
ncbi:phosphoglycolate phosphatase [Carboxydocella thermautotrophica]|nr:phosphoglycolate phosphatase [Carboxydocella thermautotrophica]